MYVISLVFNHILSSFYAYIYERIKHMYVKNVKMMLASISSDKWYTIIHLRIVITNIISINAISSFYMSLIYLSLNNIPKK